MGPVSLFSTRIVKGNGDIRVTKLWTTIKYYKTECLTNATDANLIESTIADAECEIVYYWYREEGCKPVLLRTDLTTFQSEEEYEELKY